MTAQCPLKAAAKAEGLTRYTSSTPCPKGHGFERTVATGGCVECVRVARRAQYWASSKQRDAAREEARARRARNPLAERQREVRIKLKAQYGLTEDAYAAMYVQQKGCCAVCGEAVVSRLDSAREQYSGHGGPKNNIARVDHCHSTSAVRGLLCSNCNILLGKAKDDTKILLNAVRYLDASRTAQAQPVAEREPASAIEPGHRDLESSKCRGSRRDELYPFFN